ncbi:MAG TPA: metallophosphoesterase [Verrucomicrobiae bacterium]|jgi:hypothetical protein|nr:metallophosphoesterase [Verrucomicrobiae bacterium]
MRLIAGVTVTNPQTSRQPAASREHRRDPTQSARARIGLFITVVCSILLAATSFVCATWNHFWRTSASRLWYIVPFALTFTFIAATVIARRHSSLWLRLAYRISAIWFGLLSFAFFASFGVWISAAVLKNAAAAWFGAAVLASIYGLINASWIRVTRVTAKLPNLPEAWQGRTVAVVTDLHLGNMRGAGFTNHVVAKLQKLQPRAVLISGDLYDGSHGDLDALIEPLKKMRAPAGVYYVTGNHEEFTARDKFIDAVSRTGIRVLNNEKVESDGVQIVGVHDGETDDPNIYRAALRRARLDRNRPSILLAHRPSHLSVPEAEGISLQVSGHTHGGQMWPWTWIAARVHKQFNHGLNRLGKMLVYTSYGVGTWGAPMRLGTKSEIALLRLEPS